MDIRRPPRAQRAARRRRQAAAAAAGCWLGIFYRHACSPPAPAAGSQQQVSLHFRPSALSCRWRRNQQQRRREHRSQPLPRRLCCDIASHRAGERTREMQIHSSHFAVVAAAAATATTVCSTSRPRWRRGGRGTVICLRRIVEAVGVGRVHCATKQAHLPQAAAAGAKSLAGSKAQGGAPMNPRRSPRAS